MFIKRYTNNEIKRDVKILLKSDTNKIKALYNYENDNAIKGKSTIVHPKRFGFELPFAEPEVDSGLIDWGLINHFTEVARILYRVYLLTKDSKNFNEYIKLIKNLSINEVVYNITPKERIPGEPFFDLNADFNLRLYSFLIFYIVAKWLKLKPNKEFEPLFEKCRVALDDTKWW